MRASQNIFPSKKYAMTPAQRRLSAGAFGPAGLRNAAHRSTMPPARKTEFAVAVTGTLLILSLVAGLLVL